MRRIAFLFVAVLSALVLTAADAAAAPRERGNLAGVVIGPSGKPAVGARVILQVADGSKPRSQKCDAHGEFRFSELRQGNYDVRAHAKGQWSDWEHNVLVRAGHETRVSLRLLLKEPPAGVPRAPAAYPASKPKTNP